MEGRKNEWRKEGRKERRKERRKKEGEECKKGVREEEGRKGREGM